MQRKGKRPAERSAEFEAETSLKRPLDDQEPGSPGYVRARVAEIDDKKSGINFQNPSIDNFIIEKTTVELTGVCTKCSSSAKA